MSHKRVIGWREIIDFPAWGIRGVEAKIDTGARTSALHVENVVRIPGGRVRFSVVTGKKGEPQKHIRAEAEIVRDTRVRPSSGQVQHRYVVATRVRIGPVMRKIEISLVRREHMICRMLLGRLALEDLLVDVERMYVLSDRKTKRTAKGRKKSGERRD